MRTSQSDRQSREARQFWQSRPRWPWLAGAALLALCAGCASQKTPATADVAASRAAVESAANAGAGELAPDEMVAARDKLQRASAALAAKDYRTAENLAAQAQADAALAQSKASAGKASTAAAQLQDSIRALREEIERNRNIQQQ
ncbi:MAG TPA: DUF4398 domain-containing protein [Burkholderiaceae bacterium]|nr:DUF4398 domain-containing protein [Burkholderiaceae bacterium]